MHFKIETESASQKRQKCILRNCCLGINGPSTLRFGAFRQEEKSAAAIESGLGQDGTAKRQGRTFSRKTRARVRKMAKQAKAYKKARAANTAENNRVAAPRFPAIELLNDPYAPSACPLAFKH